jgi:hypothetical protein
MASGNPKFPYSGAPNREWNCAIAFVALFSRTRGIFLVETSNSPPYALGKDNLVEHDGPQHCGLSELQDSVP